MIDLNKLRKSKGYVLAIVNTKTGEYEPLHSNVTTVDAIPIEWIEKYIDENPLMYCIDFHCYMRNMIDVWKAGKEE